MRQDQKRDILEKDKLESVVENKMARYLVNKLYDSQGRTKPWRKPIKCLCKGKNVSYVHGYTVPCGKYRCQEHVNKLRREMIMTSKEMTERRQNVAYWRQMKARHNKDVYAWSKDKLTNFKDAQIEVEVRKFLDRAEADAIWAEAALYIPKSTEEE
jgi:hypothetical protein